MTAWPVAVEVEDGLWLHARVWDGTVAEGPLHGHTYLLVHGLASNAMLWEGVGAGLAELGARAVAVDQRGHGLSDKVDHGFDFATLTDDLVAVIDALDLGRPIALGQSWGGNVVLELGIRHPQRVSGVLCLDGGHIELSSTFTDHDAMVAALTPPRLAGMPRAQIEAGMRTMMAGWPDHAVPSQLANFVLRPDGTVAPHLTLRRHLTILDHLWEHHPGKRFGLAEVPVLMAPVRGSHVESDEAVARAMAGLPNGRLAWLEGHHDVHAQKPDLVVDTVLAAHADGFFAISSPVDGHDSEQDSTDDDGRPAP